MRAPALVRGYFNLSEQTARAIRDGWYHTNYVVRRDVVGFYFFVGRGTAESMTNCRPAHLFTSLLRLLGLRFATLSFCRSCRVCYRQPPFFRSSKAGAVAAPGGAATPKCCMSAEMGPEQADDAGLALRHVGLRTASFGHCPS